MALDGTAEAGAPPYTVAETEAREVLKKLGSDAAQVFEADIRTWRPKGVSHIVTDPPYVTDDAIELYSALADFAVEVLPEHGCLICMCWGPILPAVLEAMKRPELRWRQLVWQ